MEDKKIIYTIISVLALIIVIIGIALAWYSWNNEEKKLERISLENYYNVTKT